MFLSVVVYFFILFFLILISIYTLNLNSFLFFAKFYQQKFILLLFLFIFLLSFTLLYGLIFSNHHSFLFLINEVSVYNLFTFNTFYFPFIYIFLLITILTLFFCFAYNRSELIYFSIYVLFILFAGLGLFFTNSIFIFFLFYEALLIPSFLILYNYAKTRKCIEAAYLMFF